MEYRKEFEIPKSLKIVTLTDLYIKGQKSLVFARAIVPFKTGNMRNSIHIQVIGGKMVVYIDNNYYKKGVYYYKYTNELENYSSYGWWNRFLDRFERKWNESVRKLEAKVIDGRYKPQKLSKTVVNEMSPQTILKLIGLSTNVDVKNLITQKGTQFKLNFLIAERIRKQGIVLQGLTLVAIINILKRRIKEVNKDIE